MIVGIDVSKDKLDIMVLPHKNYYQIKNDKVSIKSFMKNKISKLDTVDLIVFESTGGYEKWLMQSLADQELPYHRAHPKRVYHFAKGKGYFAKTDRIDAGILAAYGSQEEIVADEPLTLEQLQNQEISARRTQIKEMITQERNRSHSIYLTPQVKRSIKRQLKQLKNELELLNKMQEELLQKDEANKAKRKLLQTVPGVGHEVATLMVTDLPELGKLSREGISNLVGVAPQTRASGKKDGYRPIGKGRHQVRKVLYMSALVAMRHNPVLKPQYDRLICKGKKPKVALVALMRKLIITMNAMVRDNKPWELQANLT